MGPMTDLLERAVAAARAFLPDAQDDIARLILSYTGHDSSVVTLTAEVVIPGPSGARSRCAATGMTGFPEADEARPRAAASDT